MGAALSATAAVRAAVAPDLRKLRRVTGIFFYMLLL